MRTEDNNPDFKKICNLMTNFSIETTPIGAKKISCFSSFLKPKSTVYITFLPGSDYNETIATAIRLSREGMVPAPHFAARSITSERMLEDFISRVTSEAGVRKILIIGGAGPIQEGPFSDSMSLLETGLFDKYGINEIGFLTFSRGVSKIIFPIKAKLPNN